MESAKLIGEEAKQIEIEENYVYSMTGSPTPKDLEQIMEILLNENLKNGIESK